MALRAHETKAVTTVTAPVTTLANLQNYGADVVLCSTTADVRFTVDGITTPIITGASEVGTLLRSTDLGILLTAEEFVNSKWTSVSGTARVQFEFLSGDRHRIQ